MAVTLKATAQAKKLHEAAHRQLNQQRNTAASRLRTGLNALLGEVKDVLAPDDLRWKGFNLPTPEEAKRESFKEARELKATKR